MNILVGLGNPGFRYKLTRHNVGFLFLDFLAEKLKIPFSTGKGDYYFGLGEIENTSIKLIKPTTFMNNSGLVIEQIETINKENLENILIIYDDLHLPFGTIRFRPSGSDAGHNGIKSLIYHLESDQFPRLRIGIGSQFEDQVEYVLSNFSEEEFNKLPEIFESAVSGVKTWITNGMASTMNDFNGEVLKKVTR